MLKSTTEKNEVFISRAIHFVQYSWSTKELDHAFKLFVQRKHQITDPIKVSQLFKIKSNLPKDAEINNRKT